MKKLLLLLMVVGTFNAFSQNIQLHYDFHKDRNYLTSTIEMFKPDKLGNTFFFVDMNYGMNSWNDKQDPGVNLAYWEIARVIKPASFPIGFHAEFDGGLGRFNIDTVDFGYRINEAWLAGVDYSWNAKDFSKGFSVKALYKYIEDKHDATFQLTGVWYAHFLNKRITFNGFFDFWKEDNVFKVDGKEEKREFVFLSEPQIWYNVTKNFSAGAEVELGYNFAAQEGFHAYPTLGVKWQF